MKMNSIQLARMGVCGMGLATLIDLTPARAMILPAAPLTMQVGRAGNDLQLTVKGAPGSTYAVYSSATGDRNGSWDYVTSVVTDAKGTANYTVAIDSGKTQRYYSALAPSGAALLQTTSLNSENEVYSLNVVGYVNVTCPPGFSLIANQLNASPNNNLTNLIKNVPYFTTFSIFNPATGFSTYTFDDIDSTWLPDSPTPVLAPGGGGFIRNNTATNFTVTFVGEVLEGSLTNSLPAGRAIVSSKVPVTGRLTELLFPASPGDLVHVHNNLTGYATYSFDDIDLIWLPGNPGGPTINVGQAFFAQQLTPKNWIRNFTVPQ
jgi:hypothetical protein